MKDILDCIIDKNKVTVRVKDVDNACSDIDDTVELGPQAFPVLP